MKFSIRKMLASSLLAGVLTFCAAGAASFEGNAQALNDIGLLSGTQNGYDLDRAGTRAEAAAMLVRLLGKDAEAAELWQTDAADFPFTDLEDSAWAKPSVNWLVKNGLAAGTTETTFAPRTSCSAQMAATFLLRALGYSDAAGGDFTYANAMDFAREKGVADLLNCNEQDFRRDHLVAMCYTTLSLQPKTGEADLLSKLVADGVVADNEASKALRQRFADYRDYIAVNNAYVAGNQNVFGANSVAAKLDANISMSVEGEKIDMGMKQEIAVKLDLDKPEAMEMAATGSIDLAMSGTENESASIPNAFYFKDGIAYIDTAGEKMKMEMGMQEAIAQASMMDMQSVSTEPISALSSISKSTADGKTVYAVSYNAKLLGDLVDEILDSMTASLPELGDETIAVTIDKVDICETVSAENALESMKLDLSMKVGDGSIDIDMDMTMNMEITAIGDAVTVNFPDLSAF